MKKNAGWILFSILLVTASPAMSDAWHENGRPVEDAEWRKSKDGLGVLQLLTNDPDGFIENWEKPTEGVQMSTTNRAVPGEPVHAFILFIGCKADSKNNCNLSVRYRILDPLGKVYGETEDIEVWIDKPAQPTGILGLGVNSLGIILEPKDPLGEYEIFATVTDRNSGTAIEVLQRLELVEVLQD